MFRIGRQPGGSATIKQRAFSLPTLVAVGLAIALLVFLVTRFDVDLGATWNKVKSCNPWLLASAFLLHYTTFVFRGARWRIFLQNAANQNAANQDAADQNAHQNAVNAEDDEVAGVAQPPLPGVIYCSQLVLLGWFANAVGWLRLGDVYRAYLYREEQKASFSRTMGTILAERTLDTLLVALVLAATIPFLIRNDGEAAQTVLAVAAALVVLLAAMLAAMFWMRRWAARRLPRWLAERYSRFQEGALGSFRRLLPVTILGVLAWAAEVARLYLVVRALDLDVGIAAVVFLTMANSLLTLVPTPGGLGAVESGVASLAVRLSTLTGNFAAALVVVDRAITYLSIIVVGALLFAWRQVFRRAGRTASGPDLQGENNNQL